MLGAALLIAPFGAMLFGYLTGSALKRAPTAAQR